MLLIKAKRTKDLLRRLFQTLVVLLVMMIMKGCAHELPKREIEVWFIDNEELLLYRYIKGGQEQVIPLKSKSMDRFMCVDKKKAELLIGDIIKEK